MPNTFMATALLACLSAACACAGPHVALAHTYTPGACLRPQELQAVIFDCDGVLVDSEGHHAEAWVRAFHDMQLPFTQDAYLPYVGFDDAYIVAHESSVSSPEQGKALIAAKRRHYEMLQRAAVTPISSGVVLVQILRAHRAASGYKIALASSSPRAEIMRNLAALGLSDAFDVIVSGSDDLDDFLDAEGVNKPKPYIYQRAAQRLGVSPASCLVFEDTPAGVRAAHSAGMTVYAVPNMWTAHMHFDGAQAVLTSLSTCEWAKVPTP